MAQRPNPHTHYHKDGSLWAKGQMLDGQMHGKWEFFRKNGTMLRSGAFERGEQVGTWTTYDKAGKPYKTKLIKPRAAKTAAKASRMTAKAPAAKAPGSQPRKTPR